MKKYDQNTYKYHQKKEIDDTKRNRKRSNINHLHLYEFVDDIKAIRFNYENSIFLFYLNDENIIDNHQSFNSLRSINRYHKIKKQEKCKDLNILNMIVKFLDQIINEEVEEDASTTFYTNYFSNIHINSYDTYYNIQLTIELAINFKKILNKYIFKEKIKTL